MKEYIKIIPALLFGLVFFYLMFILLTAFENTSTYSSICKKDGGYFIYDAWKIGTSGKCIK